MISCPKCGGQLYYRPGKWGAYYRCVNHPDCRGKMSTQQAWIAEKKALILQERENKRIQEAAQAIANMRKAQ